MILLIILDTVSVYLSIHFAMLSRFGKDIAPTFWFTLIFLLIITFFIFLYQNLYDRKRYIKQTEIFLKIVLSSFFVIILYVMVTFFTKFKLLELSRIVMLLFFIYFLFFNITFRILIAPFIFGKWFASDRRKKTVVAYATHDNKIKIFRMIKANPIIGFRLCDRKKEECTTTAFVWCRGTDIGAVYRRIKGKLENYTLIEAIIPAFQNFRIEIGWTKIGGMPVWEFSNGNHHKLTDCTIRLLDIIISLFVIILLGIPMLIIALLVRLDSGSPVFFRQERVGKDGKPFMFLKFRSMKNKLSDEEHKKYVKTLINGKRKDGDIFKMEDDSRITRFGRFIRKTSIDELPQFFNVLKGDMSVVGHRPPIAYEVKMYKKWHKERLKMKPGITGMWQVFGRSSLPFDESVFLDLYYKENRSVLLNLYLFLKTIPRVLTSVGAE